MIERLESLVWQLKTGHKTKEEVAKELTEIVYDVFRQNTLSLFLQIQQLEREEMEKKLQHTYLGGEQANNNFLIIKDFIEENEIKEAKRFIKELYKLYPIIEQAKIFFPKGESYNNCGKSFCKKITDIILKNKEHFLEGGKDHEWAKTYGHLDYIKMIIEKYGNNYE